MTLHPICRSSAGFFAYRSGYCQTREPKGHTLPLKLKITVTTMYTCTHKFNFAIKGLLSTKKKYVRIRIESEARMRTIPAPRERP